MKYLIAALALLLAAAPARAETQGVSDDAIVLGTHLDLSGPLGPWGRAAANGMKLAVERINAEGGINGRELRLVVEDNQFDTKRAVQATEKLLDEAKVFALVGQMGTAGVMAAMPLVLERGVPHLFPMTAAVQTYEPFDRLKFARHAPYIVQAAAIVADARRGDEKSAICVLGRDDEFGRNVRRGAEAALGDKKLAAAVAYQRGTKAFGADIGRLREAKCDLVLLGATMGEAASILKARDAMGWTAAIVGTSAAYVPELPRLAGEAAQGFRAVGQLPIPDPADEAQAAWLAAYKEKFDVDGDARAATGYDAVMLAAEGLRGAGRELSVDSLVAALEQLRDWQPPLGGPAVGFDAERHLASEEVFLAEVDQGRWRLVKQGLRY